MEGNKIEKQKMSCFKKGVQFAWLLITFIIIYYFYYFII